MNPKPAGEFSGETFPKAASERMTGWADWLGRLASPDCPWPTTRDSMAACYRRVLVVPGALENVDWRRVNEAIIVRWSLAGLKYVKTRAWAVTP